MLRLIPLLFLAACVNSAPTTYSQGVPVAPPVTTAPSFTTPGATPVGRGGPMVGQPGYAGPAENLPRSTYTRMLPQTPETRREAGFWASDSGDRGSRPVPKLSLFAVPLPTAPEAQSEKDALPSLVCADLVASVTVVNHPFQDELVKLTEQQTQCLAARAYFDCLDDAHKTYAKAKANKSRQWTHGDERMLNMTFNALAAAAKFQDEKCTADSYDYSVRILNDQIRKLTEQVAPRTVKQ